MYYPFCLLIFSSTTQASSSTADWQTIKKYLDPNPQLRGIEKGRYAPKVCCVEELDVNSMDTIVLYCHKLHVVITKVEFAILLICFSSLFNEALDSKALVDGRNVVLTCWNIWVDKLFIRQTLQYKLFGTFCSLDMTDHCTNSIYIVCQECRISTGF